MQQETRGAFSYIVLSVLPMCAIVHNTSGCPRTRDMCCAQECYGAPTIVQNNRLCESSVLGRAIGGLVCARVRPKSVM